MLNAYAYWDVGTAYTKRKRIYPSGMRPPPLKGEELNGSFHYSFGLKNDSGLAVSGPVATSPKRQGVVYAPGCSGTLQGKGEDGAENGLADHPEK
jgi:hypothetical protein